MSNSESDRYLKTLSERVAYRDRYWDRRDPFVGDRLLWRSQSFRHLVHLRPGQSILVLGVGQGLSIAPLLKVTRGENPITCINFGAGVPRPAHLPAEVEYLSVEDLPGPLAGRRFDFVVGMDVLDRRGAAWLMMSVLEMLAPGGEVILHESNPWNPMLKLKRLVGRALGRHDPRGLLPKPQLYELLSELGYLRVFAVYNDFVYPPLTRRLGWVMRNLSILLENAPLLSPLAGSLLVHAQAPPRIAPKPAVSLAVHPQLHGAVSVVVPCHNEGTNLLPLVHGLTSIYGDYLHEIVLVDDNSKDNTRAVIEGLAAEDARIKPVIRSMPNGVGRALRDGYAAATGKWVLSMDCDFQHLLPELRDLFDAAAEGYDVAVGSRFSRHSVLLNYPFQKIVANRGFHALARLLLWRTFRDLTNNLKLMRREVLEQMVLTQPGFSINAETGLQPIVMGCKVREVPISWINRTPDMGSSSFKLAKVGGGYGQVLWWLWRRVMFKTGPYAQLKVSKDVRRTARELRPKSDLTPTLGHQPGGVNP